MVTLDTLPAGLEATDPPTPSGLIDPAHQAAADSNATCMRPSDLARTPEGVFRFKFHVPKGLDYCVEACSDLRTWRKMSTGCSQGRVIQETDPGACGSDCRFYRVRSADGIARAVLGFASLSIPPGHSMISNPFAGGQSLEQVFCGWPSGTRLSRFDATQLRLVENRVERGRWMLPGVTLSPGEGALFYNPSLEPREVTFLGELSGRHSIAVPSGFSLCGAPLPLGGTLEEMSFPLQDGDAIHLFDCKRQEYVVHLFENGRWAEGPPVIGVGGAFWAGKKAPASWEISLEALLC